MPNAVQNGAKRLQDLAQRQWNDGCVLVFHLAVYRRSQRCLVTDMSGKAGELIFRLAPDILEQQQQDLLRRKQVVEPAKMQGITAVVDETLSCGLRRVEMILDVSRHLPASQEHAVIGVGTRRRFPHLNDQPDIGKVPPDALCRLGLREIGIRLLSDDCVRFTEVELRQVPVRSTVILIGKVMQLRAGHRYRRTALQRSLQPGCCGLGRAENQKSYV